ncbi:microtubule-associated protein 1B-like [Schistocerca piceifrons]|uniref:microtubule-associated protein 1B-like n=1 Tax=Schistocerca piceifrons TaxID=274613 RepID=UPI001F5F3256|nr:microtubule-associated protein 1B-like [Schistocerca piceifrons]
MRIRLREVTKYGLRNIHLRRVRPRASPAAVGRFREARGRRGGGRERQCRPPWLTASTAGAANILLSVARIAKRSRALQNVVVDFHTADHHSFRGNVEPALPRRKKHPELAYRTHEFLAASDDSLDSAVPVDRARSEERGGGRARPARRSKSEGPPQSEYRLQYMKFAPVDRSDSDPCDPEEDQDMMTSSLPPTTTTGNPLSSALSRISTEYRLQFAWPRGGRTKTDIMSTVPGNAASGPPRKSLSMGAIRSTGPAPVHKKRSADFDRGDEGASELEPLVGTDGGETMKSLEDHSFGEEKIQKEILSKEEKPRHRKEYKTEYKKKFQPFSHYDYVEGKFFKKKHADPSSQQLLLSDIPHSDSWYCEVLELRKKAGEYKHRGWGTELVPQHIAELYSKQMTLWEQVSRRSSLSALSLASTTPRSISKEEKEKENTKKSSPTKPVSHRPKSARVSTFQDKITRYERKREEKKEEKQEEKNEEKKEEKKEDKKEEKKEEKREELKEEMKKEFPRSKREYLIRHHLERTTGATDGALLPSPTREKLEPVVPRPKEEEAPNKSPQKSSPKCSPRAVRSHSVGPGVSVENRSPKRQPRAPVSSAPLAAVHKGQVNGPVHTERRPRPTSLTTTGPSRPKSSSAPLKPEEGKSHHTVKAKQMPTKSVVSGVQGAKVRGDRTKVADTKESSAEEEKKDEEVKEETVSESKEEIEPAVVKSPPEPTRVKSPEQIIMRSPEPVNWTVPLDTGKTFTVTQNVLEAMPNVRFYRGELISRPHSEVKAWTPPAVPPPAPQSAPPELAEQEQSLSGGWRSDTTETEPSSTPVPQPSQTVNGLEEKSEGEENVPTGSELTHYETPVPGTTLKCLGDVSFGAEEGKVIGTQQPGGPSGYRVLEAPSPPSDIAYQPSELGSAQGSYHVLEGQALTQESPTKPLPLVSPSSGRSLASDVLEKARTRFDKFWGKSKESPDREGKV